MRNVWDIFVFFHNVLLLLYNIIKHIMHSSQSWCRCRWIWMGVGECTVYSYTFWKAFSQTYREEVLPQIYYLFKPFKYPKFCYDEKILLCSMFCQSFYYCFFFLSNMIFLSLKSCFITHIKWDVIISSSLRLLLKVWIWYRCQNRIENHYQRDWEQLNRFYKKTQFAIYLTKTILKRTSNIIFNMKKVDLDES